MGTSTLSRFQRGVLAQLVNEGNKSYQVMADALGVAKATISYELNWFKIQGIRLTRFSVVNERILFNRTVRIKNIGLF